MFKDPLRILKIEELVLQYKIFLAVVKYFILMKKAVVTSSLNSVFMIEEYLYWPCCYCLLAASIFNLSFDTRLGIKSGEQLHGFLAHSANTSQR